MDLCDRCTDAVLACITLFVPLDESLRRSMVAGLKNRYGTEQAASLGGVLTGPEAGKVSPRMRALLDWQTAIFGNGGAYNGHTQPGFTAQTFSKAAAKVGAGSEAKREA
jgi:hypothetical protein